MASNALAQLLLGNIKRVVEQARAQVKQAVNTAMVQAYWQIGRLIVENEQQGQAQLKQLSGTF